MWGVCQILIGKLPTGTRCDTAATANGRFRPCGWLSACLARPARRTAERLAPSQPAPAEPRTGTNASGATAPDL